MNTEEVLFETLNEIIILADIYPELSEDQVVTIMDTVSSWYMQLPPDVIDRYKAHILRTIEEEKKRGAHLRVAPLENEVAVRGWDETA